MFDGPVRVRVGKRADDRRAFVRPMMGFGNARSALKAVLEAMKLEAKDAVLLPSYIGWSPREGSGVFDPVREVGVGFGFYRIARDLSIDLDDLRARLDENRFRILVVIHYFGYPAINGGAAIRLARERGVTVVEDEAHSFLSDVVGGICGRDGDVSIVSLHKLFPVESGGALILNPTVDQDLAEALRRAPSREPLAVDFASQDLSSIAEVRRGNARVVADALEELGDAALPLLSPPAPGVVPQTFPVLIEKRSRDEVYVEMNAMGFGVVSLYHTLIPEIDRSEFPDAHWLSRRVLNLPVHQDATAPELVDLVEALSAAITGG